MASLAIIGEYLCKLRVYSSNMSHSPKHAMDVASEGLALMKYAGKNLPLSPKARRMNRCSVAKYEIRYGVAMLKSGDFFLGLKKILSALVANPDVCVDHSIVSFTVSGCLNKMIKNKIDNRSLVQPYRPWADFLLLFPCLHIFFSILPRSI